MAPPVTPSPRRFLPTQSSNLRREAQPRPIEDETLKHAGPESSQFAQTPRFSFGGRRRSRSPESRPHSPPKSALIQSLRNTARRARDTDEVPGQDDEDTMLLDDEPTWTAPTADRNADEINNGPHWTSDLPMSPKRRKVHEHATEEAEGARSSPPQPTFKPPQTPASQLKGNNAPSIESALDQAGARRPPPFMRPSGPSPQEQNEPLPEAFSPHRRGQRFVPGGMASRMQQWIIETGQAAAQSRKGRGNHQRGGEGGCVMKVKLLEVKGGGPFTAAGSTADGEAVNLVLAGGGNAANDDVAVGRVVGLREPTWKMEVDGVSWTVGVDWKVLT